MRLFMIFKFMQKMMVKLS